MMKKIFFVLVVLFVFSSCEKIKENDPELIRDVIYKNTDSMNKKDINGYMETIDPEDTFKFNSTKNTVEFIFNSVNVQSKIDSFSIISLSSETAHVFTRMVFQIEGKDEIFNNMEHILIKRKDRWYIAGSLVIQ
ncbi:MAG: hypothetical protein ABIN05_04620 [candidate division WOR-3 bacterium]